MSRHRKKKPKGSRDSRARVRQNRIAGIRSYLVGAGITLVAVTVIVTVMFGIFSSPEPVVTSHSQNTPSPTPAPGSDSPAPVPSTTPPAATVTVSSHPTWGPESAPVTIIEFTDFQCSACKSYVDQALPLIRSTYGDKIHYIFRSMPVVNIHPQSVKAAEAALCAFEQGKFWEYHDMLFQNQGALDVPSLKSYAAALGLDQSAFDLSLDSGKHNEAVRKDFNDGIQLGVRNVPAFFINGRKVEGAKPFSEFQQIIDEELAKASAE